MSLPDAPAPAPAPASALAREPSPDPAVDPAIAGMQYDTAMAELKTVVGRLEAGGLPLEESIALYERGVALHDRCAQLLSAAELRVQRLVDSAGGPRALDLRPDDDEG